MWDVGSNVHLFSSVCICCDRQEIIVAEMKEIKRNLRWGDGGNERRARCCLPSPRLDPGQWAAVVGSNTPALARSHHRRLLHLCSVSFIPVPCRSVSFDVVDGFAAAVARSRCGFDGPLRSYSLPPWRHFQNRSNWGEKKKNPNLIMIE